MDIVTKGWPEFPAKHAYRHQLGPDGRESLAHMLIFPEHGIAGFIYPSVRANGMGKARAVLFGPGLSTPIEEEVEGEAPADMDFDNWVFPPLRMAVLEPHKRVALSWDGARIKFDGEFRAAYPAYAFSTHPDGNPPYYGDDRTEQHGRMVGRLEIDGKALDVDGWLVRDHSWGPRIWGLNQHYKWFHAITDVSSIHYFEMLSFGRRQLRGYLWRDGVMRHIADASYEFTYNDAMMQETFKTWVTDTDGRTAFADCKAFGHIQLDYDPAIYLNEAPITLEIDGAPGSGWCEFCWNKDYFDFAKQHVRAFG